MEDKSAIDEELGEPTGPHVPTQDERTWGLIAVLSALFGYVIPLGSVIGPFIVYLIKREESSFVAFHALQTIYFSAAVIVGMVICIVLSSCIIGIPLAIALYFGSLIYLIYIGLRAYNGEWAEFWKFGAMARNSVRGMR